MPSTAIKVVGVNQLVNTLQAVHEAYFKAVRYVVQAKAEYSKYVEYGTYKMAAQPYMRPAASDAKAAFKSIAQSAESSIEAIVQAVAAYIEARAKGYVPVVSGHLQGTIGFERVS